MIQRMPLAAIAIGALSTMFSTRITRHILQAHGIEFLQGRTITIVIEITSYDNRRMSSNTSNILLKLFSNLKAIRP